MEEWDRCPLIPHGEGFLVCRLAVSLCRAAMQTPVPVCRLTVNLVQVREPLSSRGVERHHAYAAHLAPLAERLGDEIERYEAELAQVLPESAKHVS